MSAARTEVAPDPVLERLAVAESSEELCSLLETLEGGADPKVTYAINDVLDRARLRPVRVCAVQALARQSSAEATSFLVDLAEDEDSEVELEALGALVSREGELSHMSVIDAAHSEKIQVRVNAVLTLLRDHRPEAFGLAEELLPALEDFSSLSDLTRALGESADPRAFAALSKLVEQGDRQVHLAALEALGTLGAKEAASMLAGLLAQGSEGEFRSASTALARIDEALCVSRLTELGRSENAQRRLLAVGALGGFGENLRARTALLEFARSDEAAVAAQALLALGALHEESAESLMIDAASRPGPFAVRQAALRALGQVATPSAVEALRGLVKSAPPEYKDTAFASLVNMPSGLVDAQAERVAALETHQKEFGSIALNALSVDSSPAAQAALLAYFDDPDPERVQQLRSFAANFSPQTLNALVERHQSDSDEGVRRALVAGIADRADPALAPLLRNALNDADPLTRRSAKLGLSLMGQSGADSALEELLQSADSEDRDAGIDALSRRGDTQSLDRLQELALKSTLDPTLETYEATVALRALKGVSPERAAKALATLLDEGKPERMELLMSEAQGLGQLSLAACLKGLESKDPAVLREAILRAGDLDNPALVNRIVRIARDETQDPSVRETAASTLLQIGGEQVRAHRAELQTLASDVAGAFGCHWEDS